MKKTSNVFCKKTQQLFNRKGEIVSVTASFGKKAKCFSRVSRFAKSTVKATKQFLAGCAGKTSLTCQKAHVAFSMQKNKLFVQFSIRSMFWQNVQETFVKVQRNY